MSGPPPLGLTEQFWEKVRVGTLDECWPWTGASTRRGYGKLRRVVDGVRRDLLAHRVVAHLTYGLDLADRDAVAMHRCNNPSCCNPLHVVPGTQSANVRQAVAQGRHFTPFTGPPEHWRTRGAR